MMLKVSRDTSVRLSASQEDLSKQIPLEKFHPKDAYVRALDETPASVRNFPALQFPGSPSTKDSANSVWSIVASSICREFLSPEIQRGLIEADPFTFKCRIRGVGSDETCVSCKLDPLSQYHWTMNKESFQYNFHRLYGTPDFHAEVSATIKQFTVNGRVNAAVCVYAPAESSLSEGTSCKWSFSFLVDLNYRCCYLKGVLPETSGCGECVILEFWSKSTQQASDKIEVRSKNGAFCKIDGRYAALSANQENLLTYVRTNGVKQIHMWRLSDVLSKGPIERKPKAIFDFPEHYQWARGASESEELWILDTKTGDLLCRSFENPSENLKSFCFSAEHFKRFLSNDDVFKSAWISPKGTYGVLYVRGSSKGGRFILRNLVQTERDTRMAILHESDKCVCDAIEYSMTFADENHIAFLTMKLSRGSCDPRGLKLNIEKLLSEANQPLDITCSLSFLWAILENPLGWDLNAHQEKPMDIQDMLEEFKLSKYLSFRPVTTGIENLMKKDSEDRQRIKRIGEKMKPDGSGNVETRGFIFLQLTRSSTEELRVMYNEILEPYPNIWLQNSQKLDMLEILTKLNLQKLKTLVKILEIKSDRQGADRGSPDLINLDVLESLHYQ